MSSLCEQHHHFMSSKTAPKDINLPPRKLLNRSKHLNEEISSPRTPNLNILTDDYEEETDPYSSDEFRMYEFKIRRCMRSRSHDWTDCPFAHPGEKARRRDPRRFHYSGNPCADFRHGTCPRGDSCEFAHGVFECWLHPARYRTHACKDGKKCTRKVCFFAHTPRQLRVLPLCSQSPCSSSMCTGFCQSMATSPTSTLMGLSQLSPPSSPNQTPPISPTTARKASVDSGGSGTGNYSLLQKFNEASLFSPSAAKRTLTNYLSYKNALLMELVNSLENLDMSCLDYDDQQTQFFMSPTTTTSKGFGGGRDVFSDQDYMPDLEWVNELVM